MKTSLRWAAAAVISALVFVGGGGCSTPVGQGGILAVVELEQGLVARCVKVSATDGVQTRETKNMLVAGKTSLRVGLAPDGLASTVQLRAHGFLDDGCTTPSGEQSAVQDGTFSTPPAMVTLRLGPTLSNDGGADGGRDGGLDAGFDNDGDLVPLPADCNDNDDTVYPGAPELCGDGKDNDCANGADCADTSGACNGMSCGSGNTCVSGRCLGPNENCVDGMDNNGNSLVDCIDPQCTPGTTCNDRDLCTTGETCQGDAGCGGPTSTTSCTPTEPQCQLNGVCQPDSGVCTFTNVAGTCNDTLACTAVGACMNGACVPGAMTTCASPPTCRTMGACEEPSGLCVYPPAGAGTRVGSCTDGDNCTINDACDGDGGCRGTTVSCTEPTQCHALVPGVCTGDGGCTFTPRSSCDAGAGLGAATCDSMFNCNVAGLFPYTPSNFTEPDLPADAGTAFNVTCATTLSTSGTPAITSGACVTMPPFAIITQGGVSTVLLRVPSLSVAANQTLTITGTRPVIFAVTGNVQIDGTIRARAGNGPPACGTGGNGNNSGSGNGEGGGGGGGFGLPGAAGGTAGGAGAGSGGAQNGQASLSPLRGGCNGGNGTAAGGAGGGGLQISASGQLTVANVIAAPGRGGTGAAANGGDSGGGGGSGGAILLEGATVIVTMTARITANGASGGEGSGGSSGNDGNDGIETGSGATPNGGSNSANGGNGGVGGGGTADAGEGLPGAGNNDGAGGGGGAVGRIRFNAAASCNIAGGLVSPAATSNGAAGCP
jgi:hypothetical protein